MAEDQGREQDEHRKVQRTEQSDAGPEASVAPANEPSYPASLLSDHRLDGRGNAPVRAATMLQMQRTYGNRATQRYLQRARSTTLSTAPGLPPQTLRPTIIGAEGEDEAKVGEGVPAHPVHMEGGAANLDHGTTNEWGEIDGKLTSDVKPHIFVDGGKVGVGKVYWDGGDGGQGQQNVGSISLVAPEYEGEDAAAAGSKASAWIRPGTGTATVTRSYKGVNIGDNGIYYFTAPAAARADVHEKLHVDSSKGFHDKYIAPLEKRIAQHLGKAKALSSGATKAEAITALKSFIDWNTAVTGFQTDDAAANVGGGSVDSTDMARPDFVKNKGPMKVGGKDYPNYIDM